MPYGSGNSGYEIAENFDKKRSTCGKIAEYFGCSGPDHKHENFTNQLPNHLQQEHFRQCGSILEYFGCKGPDSKH